MPSANDAAPQSIDLDAARQSVANRINNVASGWLTVTGAATVICNAATGYLTGTMSGKEALFQGGLGVVALGLRRAIARIGN